MTIIGAGKVGEALAKAFFKAGVTIDKVISKTMESATVLAEELGSVAATDIQVPFSSDYIILAVPDKAIGELCLSMGPAENSVVLHTAGSCGMEVFEQLKCKGRGVFYPLQTFTKGRVIDMSLVSFLLEGDTSFTENNIEGLAALISGHVFRVKSHDRKLIHLSAVFVCNFINHLLQAGEDIIENTGLPEAILEPLIDETIRKARDIGPGLAQTGPAIRNDNSTIEKHIDLLSFSPELRDIYKSVTRSIIKNKLS